jgi:hypothetical protein
VYSAEYHNETSNDRFLEDLIDRRVLPAQGTFFECGATGGVGGSSTYLLEARFGWSGVLAEAIEGAADVIRAHRPRSIVVPLAVTSHDDETVEFVEAGPLGTSLSYFSGVRTALERTSERAQREGWSKDQWKAAGGRAYPVRTITLNSIIANYLDGKAPTVCCLDMEGSELDALQGLDLDHFRPAFFTIEDGECNELLESSGYVRVRNPFNETMLWEEYFVEESLVRTNRTVFRIRT